METTHLYHTSVQWTEQRKATLTSPGLPAVEVATPPEFPGGHEGYWSPETLYIAAAEGCLMTTFLAIAENSKLEITSYRSEAEGTLTKTDDGFRITEITIKVNLVIADESKKERAERILEKAEQHCLISNSMKTEVHLVAEVAVG
jgi:peroxiredoxin-like protein